MDWVPITIAVTGALVTVLFYLVRFQENATFAPAYALIALCVASLGGLSGAVIAARTVRPRDDDTRGGIAFRFGLASASVAFAVTSLLLPFLETTPG